MIPDSVSYLVISFLYEVNAPVYAHSHEQWQKNTTCIMQFINYVYSQ